jgi:ethanolamine utilization cobalamin adenosyltransferase
MHEFLDFYAEIEKRVSYIKNIIRNESSRDPLQAIKFLDLHLELLEAEIEELLDLDYKQN